MAALVTAAAAVVLAPPATAHHENMAARVQAAWQFATNRNTTVAIGYMDRVTGEYRDNGQVAHQHFGSASLVKLFIADDVLYRSWRGEFGMTEYDWNQLDLMLRSSDDPAASRFWSNHGGPAIINRVKSRYGLNEIQPPPSAPWWGLTKITSFDISVYYQRMLNGAGGLPGFLADHIVAALRQYTSHGTDGFYQRHGLPDALPREGVMGVKQGWMCCTNNTRTIHTSGIVGGDSRYIVVVLGQEGSGGSYQYTQDSVTGSVRALFPDGYIHRPAEHNPFGSLDSVDVDSERMLVRSQGWVIDPDTADPTYAHLFIDNGGFDMGLVRDPRPDVAQHYPAYGPNHGFDATGPMPGGTHNVCLYGVNIHHGDGNPQLGCRTVTAPQKPFGSLDSVTPSAGKVRVVGWVAESELGGSQSPAHLLVDGVARDMGFAGITRNDLQQGYGAYGINHGFDHTATVSPGTHEICVLGIDLATSAGHTPLGCRTVTVPAA